MKTRAKKGSVMALELGIPLAVPAETGFYPDGLHPMDGYLEVARQYGAAVEHLRTWMPRRGEIVYNLRSKGVSMGKIAALLRVHRRTTYRWLDTYLEDARAFNERLAHPESVIPE